jgi:hypothetical protein
VDRMRIVLRPREDLTPGQAQNVRLAVLRFILDCHAKKEGTCRGAPDDGKEIKNVPAGSSIPRG